jgi:hypothetical protein
LLIVRRLALEYLNLFSEPFYYLLVVDLALLNLFGCLVNISLQRLHFSFLLQYFLLHLRDLLHTSLCNKLLLPLVLTLNLLHLHFKLLRKLHLPQSFLLLQLLKQLLLLPQTILTINQLQFQVLLP